MATIGSLTADFVTNVGSFTRDMGKAAGAVTSNSARMNRGLARVQRGFKRTTRDMGRMARNAVGLRSVIGTLAGTAGFGLLIKRSIDSADAIVKTADKVGLLTGELQDLRFAAEQAGVEQRTFDLGIQRFSRRVGEAVQGSGELKGTLDQYGISVVDAEGRTRRLTDILFDYADAVKGADSEQEQLRLGFKAFDSEGAALVNALRNGSEGLREMARQAPKAIPDRLLRSAARAKDQLNILGRTIQVQVTTAVLGLVPQIESLTRRLIEGLPTLTKWVERFAEFIGLIDPAPDKLGEIETQIAKINRDMATRSGAFGRGPSDREAELARLANLERERDLTIELADKFQSLNRLAAGAPTPLAAPAARPALGGAPIPGKKPVQELAALVDQMKTIEEQAKAVFESTRTPQEQFAARLVLLNDLVDQGAIKQETYARAVAQAQAELTKAGEVTEAVNRATSDLAGDALEGQIRGWKDLASAALKALGSILRKQLEVNAAAAGSGGGIKGGLLGQIVSGVLGFIGGSGGGGGGGFNAERTSSPGGQGGFARGGSFRVGGVGGPDSQPVRFDASPNETVTITRPGQTAGGGPAIQIGSIDLSNADVAAVARLERLFAELNASVEPRALRAVEDQAGRGGSFTKSLRG